tara:strand:- start:4390 stop:5112 length:723 start_codon:yes stop_codon:yes gene_type:complete
MEKDQLKRIINYCELSYKHPSDVDINAFIFLEDKKTDAQCYIFYDYQTAYITFRGTSSLKDWMADLKCSTVSPDIYKDVRIQVHSGFYDQYASLRKDIILKILHLQYMYKIYNFVICGHSLGGALTTLCALDLIMNDYLYDPIVVTIGAPRVGNTAFANQYKQNIKNSFRLTNINDPIPYFPLTFRFHHPHKSLCYEKGIIVHKKRMRGFLTRLLAIFKNVRFHSAISNHSLDKYVDNFV